MLAICPKVLWTPSFWSVMTYSLFSLVFIYVFVFKQPPCYLQMNLWKSKCKEVENVFTVLIMVYLFINSFVNDTLEGTMILNSQAIIHLVLWLRLVIFSDWKSFVLRPEYPFQGIMEAASIQESFLATDPLHLLLPLNSCWPRSLHCWFSSVNPTLDPEKPF